MDKQEKAQRLLHDVSAGLTALTQAMLHARAVHPFIGRPTPLGRVYDHAQQLGEALEQVQARWPGLTTVSLEKASSPAQVPPLDTFPVVAQDPIDPAEAPAGPLPEDLEDTGPSVTPQQERPTDPAAELGHNVNPSPADEPEVPAESFANPALDAEPSPVPHVEPEVPAEPAVEPALDVETFPEVHVEPASPVESRVEPIPGVAPSSETHVDPSLDAEPSRATSVEAEAPAEPVVEPSLDVEAFPETPVEAESPTEPVVPTLDVEASPAAPVEAESPTEPVVEPALDAEASPVVPVEAESPAEPFAEPFPVEPVVEPLLIQGDLAPFEPEHDQPIDQDVIAVVPLAPAAPFETDVPDLVQTLPQQLLPLAPADGRAPSVEVQAPTEAAGPEDEELEIEDVVDEIHEEVLPIFFEDMPMFDPIPTYFDLVRKGQTTFQKDGQDTEVVRELHRLLHTLKGNAGMVGAFRARTLIHVMESMMEEAEAGRLNLASVVDNLEVRYSRVMLLIDALERREFNYQLPKRKPVAVTDEAPTATTPVIMAPQRAKGVRVDPEMLDRLVNEANEAKLTRSGLDSSVTTLQGIMRDLDENVQGLIKMLRELEIHAESQIQSRRSQIEETGEEFDPLEFDRFTRLQELARFLSERAHDTLDLQQGASRAVAEQETLLAYQERSVNELQESLTKTRLTPFDEFTGPLVRVTKQAAQEEGKEVDVVMVGERTELDRALIEKITTPLSHALRNAVVHGIERRDERVALGKPAKGQITITVRQEAGRVFINVQDDGGGIRVDKVHQKAIERGLWAANRPMSDQEAADMVCTPHFSTVDTVSQLAGRGVGMDVVRSDVLALGGRFDLRSVPGKGLTVALQLPTTLSTASTLIVEAQGERVSIPVECIEHVLSMKRDEVLQARERGWIELQLQDDQARRIDFRYLPAIMGMKVSVVDPSAYNQVVVVRESDVVVAVLVDRLIGTQEVPIRPIGRTLSRLPGIVGTTVLSDGHAAFVLDPARTRAAFVKQTAGKVSVGGEIDGPSGIIEAQETQDLPSDDHVPRLTASTHRGPPLVMVVDDSLTVRKASARFLQREGYDHVLAKDGQEAVEMLATVNPDLILLDVEMPRMDGFDFAKHVREHPRHNQVPIIMITSRIADKHRKRADAIGVNDYLGKPFKEEELLALLQRYTGQEA